MPASPKFSSSLMLALFCVFVLPASAKTFLKFERSENSKDFDMREEVESSLLKHLAANFRPGANQDNIIKLEAQIKPMFDSAPKNADNTISQKVVRYVLHRFFLQRGWFIQGLQPLVNTPGSPHFGATANHTNVALQVAQEWVPTYLHEFLEQWHGGGGTSLRELAVFAATVEDLGHKEALWTLDKVLSGVSHRPKRYDEEAVSAVLGRLSILDPSSAKNFRSWNNLQEWFQNVILEVVHPHEELGPVDHKVLGQIVESIWERYASYHQKECATLKSQFLRYESQKPGRVRLADFYEKGLTVDVKSNYRIAYLRDLGVLDESNPEEPLVILSNYMGSRPNCKTVSGFHAICCRNECEDLLGELENRIGATTATPTKVLALVATLASDTVEAPRTFSSSTVKHLHKIADGNGGQVPLHGRLFAQWMHHAYPRECPFQNVAHTTTAETPQEWSNKTGLSSRMTDEEMVVFAIQHRRLTPDDSDDIELPWTDVEDLLMDPPEPAKPQQWRMLRRLAVFGALVSVAWIAKWLIHGTSVNCFQHGTGVNCFQADKSIKLV